MASQLQTQVSTKGDSPCVACPNNGAGICAALLRDHGGSQHPAPNWQHYRIIQAGKQVVFPKYPCPDVYLLCSGWGVRFLRLRDGRRQILNFLLPGDLFSTSSVFEEVPHFSVAALTLIQVNGMRRAEVQSRLAANPALVEALARSSAAEAQASDMMMTALGRYSAEERIAYLLLHLARRISARSVIRGLRYPLPLRQQHIADAVGLTPVHVSRVLRALREGGIADLSNGFLELFDLHRLEQLSSLS